MPHILLIEDDREAGESIQAMLEVVGHTVSWAKHGKEAVVLVQNGLLPDAVLTDILMPEMDGLENIQYFKKKLPSIPLIAMTAQRDAPYLKAAALFGAAHTLNKPFSLQELKQAIEKALHPMI